MKSTRGAISLEKTHELHPRDQEALFALVSFHRDAGEIASALEYAIRLQNLAPEDPRWRQLVTALESGR